MNQYQECSVLIPMHLREKQQPLSRSGRQKACGMFQNVLHPCLQLGVHQEPQWEVRQEEKVDDALKKDSRKRL